MSSGLKVKGHQRAKGVTPYERPKSVAARVRNWLSPGNWSGYFSSGSSSHGRNEAKLGETEPHEGETTPTSVAVTSSNECDIASSSSMLTQQSFHSTNLAVDTHEEDGLPEGTPSGNLSEIGEEEASFVAVNNEAGDEDMEQDVSWVAEDLGEDDDEAERERGVKSSESLAARPASITLPHVGSTTVSAITNSDSLSYTYEGEVNVVQHSSLLLTPGAEAPVVRVTNPFFASQLPRVTLHGEGSTATISKLATPNHHMTMPSQHMTTPQRDEDLTSGIQSEFIWSLPRQVGQFTGSQPVGVASQSRGGSSVASTYTVTLTKPLMSSTVVRSKLPKISASLDGEADYFTVVEKQEKRVSMTTSIVATSISMTTPSVERSHMQATLNKSSFPQSVVNRSSKDTEESIRRSPFHSPFYSGRTVYGGAAANQRMKLKRQRSSDISMSMPVCARVQPSSTSEKPSLLSSTARKILDSLQSSSSPLKDVRRMPMRQLSNEDMVPTKRRRLGLSPDSSLISPTPVSTPPPHSARPPRQPSPTRHSAHQSLPATSKLMNVSPKNSSSKGLLSSKVSLSTGQTGISSLSSFSASSSFVTSLNLPKFVSSTPKPSSFLSGLTFKPAPPTVELQSCARSDKEEAESMTSSSNVGRGTGKLRVGKKSQQHFSRRTDTDEVDSSFANPLPLPPSVGLKMAASASFNFHAQSSTSSSSAHPLSSGPASSQDSSNFSFSQPRVISSTLTSTKQTVSSSFVFSLPKSHVLSPLVTYSTRDALPSDTATFSTTSTLSTAAMRPFVSHSIQPSSKKMEYKPTSGPALVKPRLPAPTTKAPPPLLSGSVEDVFNSMIKGGNSGIKIPSTEAIKPEETKPTIQTEKIPVVTSSSSNSLVSKFAPPAGSWDCETCCVSNKQDSTCCVACSTPKPGSKTSSQCSTAVTSSLAAKFALPSSWECDTCMIINKSDATSCAACSAPKPGSKSATTSIGKGGLIIGASGGFKLSSGKGLQFGSQGGLKIGSEGGLKVGSEGGLKVGSEGGLKVGSEGGLKIGSEGFKLGGQESLKLGSQGGLKFGNKVLALKTGNEDLKVGLEASVKSGTEGIKLGNKGIGGVGSFKSNTDSFNLGTRGGMKLGTEVGVKLGTERGLKLGTEGGVKLGTEGGVKLGTEGGLKLGTEGGLKLGTEGGLKLGTEGGVKLGTERGLKLGTEGGLKLGTEGGLKLGTEGGVTLGTERGLKLGIEGGVKLGTERGLKLGTEGGVKLGTEGGLKLGTEGGMKLGTEGGMKLGTEGGMKLGTEGALKPLISTSSGFGSLKFGSFQSTQSLAGSTLTTTSGSQSTRLSTGSPFSISTGSPFASKQPEMTGSSTPFVFSGANLSSAQGSSLMNMSPSNVLFSSVGSAGSLQSSTTSQTSSTFSTEGARDGSLASGPPNVNFLPTGGGQMGSPFASPAAGKLRGLSFKPVPSSQPTLLQFGSGSGGSLGGSSVSITSVSSQPTLQFGAGSSSLGGSSVPVTSVSSQTTFQFGSSGGLSLGGSSVPVTNMSSQPTLQFGAGSSSFGGSSVPVTSVSSQTTFQFGAGSNNLGGSSLPQLGSGQNMFGSGSGQTTTPFNFQSSQSNIFGSAPSGVSKPTFNFGASQSGPVLGANSPSSNVAVPQGTNPFQFSGNNSSSSSSTPAFPLSSTTTASRADLKKRVFKKAARRIKN